MSWFPGMGCFLSLHLAAFWGFFGMEVGMLMPPAPLGPPPGWAGGERCFFLFSFVPPSPHPPSSPPALCGGPRAGCWVGGCACASCRVAGWSWLAGVCHLRTTRPHSAGTREKGRRRAGQGWPRTWAGGLLPGWKCEAPPVSPTVSFPFVCLE